MAILEILIAQQSATTDLWTLFINGRDECSTASVDEAIDHLRRLPTTDLPLVISVSLERLVDLEAREPETFRAPETAAALPGTVES